MSDSLKNESQLIIERVTFNVRADVLRNWDNVKTACDYLVQQRVDITIPRVVRHIKIVLKGKPSSQAHFYRKEQEYGRYVQARANEQAGGSQAGAKLAIRDDSYEHFMAIAKEDLVHQLLWIKGDVKQLKRDNDRLRAAFGKLEFNPENYLAHVSGQGSVVAADHLQKFLQWLASNGLKITPLAFLLYDDEGTQLSRLSDEDIVKSLAQLCNTSVDQLVKIDSPENKQ